MLRRILFFVLKPSSTPSARQLVPPLIRPRFTHGDLRQHNLQLLLRQRRRVQLWPRVSLGVPSRPMSRARWAALVVPCPSQPMLGGELRFSTSANALRNASSYLKHKQAAAAIQWVESFVMVDEQGSINARRVLNKDEVTAYEFLRTQRFANLDTNQLRTVALCYPANILAAVLLLFLVHHWPVFPSWLPVFVWLLLRIRGFCDIEFENLSTATACVVSHVFCFFLVL